MSAVYVASPLGFTLPTRTYYAVLDGEDVDSGTASEIGFAAALGRRVVGWRSDLRQAGDNRQSLVNLQVEHFVRSSGGSLHLDLDAALAALVGA